MGADLQFPSIKADAGNDNPYLKNGDSTPMVEPKNVMTGNSGGDWNIKGRILVTDANGVVRLVLGFDPNGF